MSDETLSKTQGVFSMAAEGKNLLASLLAFGVMVSKFDYSCIIKFICTCQLYYQAARAMISDLKESTLARLLNDSNKSPPGLLLLISSSSSISC